MKEALILATLPYGLLAAASWLAGPMSEQEKQGFKVVEKWPWE
jgi:hypothetical protein